MLDEVASRGGFTWRNVTPNPKLSTPHHTLGFEGAFDRKSGQNFGCSLAMDKICARKIDGH